MKRRRPTRGPTLDGIPDEPVLGPTGPRRRALGHDPFAEGPVVDPFLERLEALLPGEPVRARPATPEEPPTRLAPEPEPAALWRRTPALDEVELPEIAHLAERFMSDDVRRRLAALGHLPAGKATYDRFGFSPAAARDAFPLFHAIYRAYFRVESEGHERLPAEGPAVLASNHGGLLPFDGAMTVVDVLLHTDPPRLPRAIVDRWVDTLPWINTFLARVGQVIGTRENVRNLLEDGQLVLVFPEGMAGIQKRVTDRYRLQEFHSGFVAAALRARAPIVPMAVLGAENQAPILFDMAGLAKRLSLPFFPVTPTFPWFGPLGLLPYPVRYRIVYGEPLHFHEAHGPAAAEDRDLVNLLARQVRRKIQRLVDRNR